MALSLASLFSDHMVLQAGKPVAVWGRAGAGVTVAVRFAGQEKAAQADAQGNWSVKLDPLPVCDKGRELVVSTSQPTPRNTPQSITLRDVLVGEVWLCSGQSNMQWTVSQANGAPAEKASANDSLLRVATIPRKVSDTPLDTLPAPTAWEPTNSRTVDSFTAAGYYFGKELRQRLNVPIGLIHSSWGGTIIETWTSKQALQADPAGKAIVEQFDADRDNIDAMYEKWQQKVASIDVQYADRQNLGHPRGWAGPDETADTTWKDMTLPAFWQSASLDFSGILWFRKVVDVPADWAGRDLELAIGAADKSDDTYFNNEHVGSMKTSADLAAWNLPRVYRVPGRLVKAGRNVIAVRVHSDKFAGGLHGPAHDMHLTCPGLPDTKPIPLTGVWRYAIEANYGRVEIPAPPPGPDQPNFPCRLHNAMLKPLIPYTMRGVIWYQGESNAARHQQYRSLFPTFIRDLRSHWEDDALAFHFVQLANYQGRSEVPTDTPWARLREAQAMALSLPHTGMAVIIDIGEANDIHPRNKLDVGRRLAYNALHSTYGRQEIVPCGPLYRQAVAQDGVIRIHFDHVYDGLEARDGKLAGFAIAGADKQFVWADARIEGNLVCVWSDAVPQPAYVRYAWDSNPQATLYNKAGLPASPFRTDRD